jgi:formylglycine-generating enzyme required for sulfatase activity
METITYRWSDDDHEHAATFVLVRGTGSESFVFGEGSQIREFHIQDFYLATTLVTQAFWCHVMGVDSNPASRRGDDLPVEFVAWDDITGADGFLDRINRSRMAADLADGLPNATGLRFRLPTETEWEYAARGGPDWRDGFQFSGGNDIDAVAWYDANSGKRTHDVATKAPNQLGVFDMSGNVWEWCHDTFVRDIGKIPSDGRPYVGEGTERVLRGGCNHNWAEHCTVSKRYEISHDARDGSIGFRLALAS